MKKLIALIFVLVMMASAQNYSTVSGTAVLDKNGNTVTGTIEFIPDREFGFVGGSMACCNKDVQIKATVTAGSFSGLLVPRKDRVNPLGVCFTVFIKDATGKVVQGPDGYRCVQPTGASYDFGTYTPLAAAVPNTPQAVFQQDCSLLGANYVLQTINPDGTSKCVLSSGGSGTVTHIGGALTNGAVVVGAGGADTKTSGVTVDGSNNVSTPGAIESTLPNGGLRFTNGDGSALQKAIGKGLLAEINNRLQACHNSGSCVFSTVAEYQDNLSVFAPTTSAQFLGVILDAVGSGSKVAKFSAVSGNSGTAAQSAGSLTNGNLAKFDANGNIVDSGSTGSAVAELLFYSGDSLSGASCPLTTGSTCFIGRGGPDALSIATTETGIASPISISGTVASMYCTTFQPTGSGVTWVLTLRKNLANITSGPACTITNASLDCNSTANTGTIAAGDRLDVLGTIAGGTMTNQYLRCSVKVTGAN